MAGVLLTRARCCQANRHWPTGPGLPIPIQRVEIVGITLRELAHAGKINLRGGSALHGPATTVTGCASLPAANQFVSAGDRHLVWLGPDEYLLLCEAGAETELKQRLDSLIGTSKAVATDVSDALCALNCADRAIRQTLAKRLQP